METDYLIIGQGLCGSWLGYYLMKSGASVMVIDRGTAASASSAASGIINPITGKRLARQWMSEQILPFAKQAYETLSAGAGQSLAEETSIHTFFANAAEADFFEQKASSSHEDLLHYSAGIKHAGHFNFHYGIGTIHPALLIDVNAFLHSQRQKFAKSASLLEEQFNWEDCTIDKQGAHYKDIHAKAVIDCSGSAAIHNPYFNRLPFALNKGEAILASIPGLSRSAIYKYSNLSIVPWEKDLFWIGSTYDWDFRDELPTTAFRDIADRILKQWLKLPYVVHGHFAAIRPATVTRDAFSGLHPHHSQIGILNGMGSKGCSLSPFLANNLADHLLNAVPLIPQVDVSRYTRLLS